MFTHHRPTDSRPDHDSAPRASRHTGVVRRVSAAAAVLLAVTTGAAACSSSSDTASNGGDSQPKVINVTFSGDSVTPNGDRVEVQHGQPIELKVTADKPGEIHVHSNPEQELSYDKGTSTVEIKPIDQPGIIEVESHALEKTIVQLEVR